MSDVGERMSGSVKWFNSEKGYGFIVVDGFNRDIFVHRSQLSRSGLDELLEGEKVTFTLNFNPKKSGHYATEISRG